MTTIYDVARCAQVSPATVSRVLNGAAVSPRRVEAVMRAVRELGFVPNSNARRLRTRDSELIAMLIPDVTNSFYTEVLRAVEDQARAAGFAVMVCNTDDDFSREAGYLRAVVSQQVAGIISVPVNKKTDFSLAGLHSVPVVALDRSPGLAENLHPICDTVVVANVGGGALSTRSLADSGYRRIACISGPRGTETADLRVRGWRQAVTEITGSTPDPQLEVRGSFSFATGVRAMQTLLNLDHPPDAVFATNNRLAAGALQYLEWSGRIPPQIGLCSFGTLRWITSANQGLLHLSLPARRMGSIAANMLLERIRGLNEAPRRVVLDAELEHSHSYFGWKQFLAHEPASEIAASELAEIAAATKGLEHVSV